MTLGRKTLLAASLAACAAFFSLSPPRAAADPAPVDFARDIRPLLERHCFGCHGGGKQEGGIRLNSRESAFAGGDSGDKGIVPGKPEESRLWRLVAGKVDGELMPPKGEGEPLSAEQIDLLSRWIAAGADWPAAADSAEPAIEHWAFRSPATLPLPTVQRTDWPKQGLDYFVLQRLEKEGLAPSPEADPHTLIRRVYLDIVGIPPSPAEVAEFIDDREPGAYERMVDKLLANPAYGERWGRMWLDLARYADSKGYGSDPLRSIWRYRDWVIDAFNRNLPYDRFTREQLAGDLLPDATVEQVLATAFHRNTMANDEGGTDNEEFRVAAIKDRIETTMQVWMGLTASCAKCHSHKFDPLTQREYYQLYAFFNQTEDNDLNDEAPRAPTPTKEQQAAVERLRGEIAAVRQTLDTPTPELAVAQAAWERMLATESQAWQPLDLAEFSAAKGTTLVKQPDGSLLATGAAVADDTYTVSAVTDLAGITGFSIEALPDDSLPGKGPGRAANGAFVLNDVRVVAAPKAQPAAIQGRYVKVEIPGSQKILSLAEVQVLRGADNLALKGKASQSSVAYGGDPQRAIDGNVNGDYFAANSVTHTETEDAPWWECDLGETREVERIVLWNRTDGDVGGRLSAFRVYLLNEQKQVVWETTVADAPKPNAELTLGGAGRVTISKAIATFEQEAFPAALAIDADAQGKSGWAIGPRFGQPHAIALLPEKPVGLAGGSRIELTLSQGYGEQHLLGRFRILVTVASPPPAATPGRVRELAATAVASRTAEQAAELAAYYRSTAPALQPQREQLAKLEAELQATEKAVPLTPILRELAGDKRRVTKVMVKGNFLNPADEVQAAVPVAFHPLREGAPLDRLGFADWLTDERNPLTARVAVNRFWAQLFGAGIVETEEDFGTQGAQPTNQDLLDWLAVEFRKTWDMKALLKTIVASATYRQSSSPTAELLQRDASNRLLARGPRHRLEAEMVRDQSLALAGLLSKKIGGPSVYPPQPDGLWRAAFNGERTWATSTGEDRYRRGLYTYWRRTVPYPSMAAFDAPSREICTVRRISTNTPLQAFVTMNDPVYVEAAQALGRRLVREGGATVAERAAYGLQLCLVRPPKPEQVQAVVSLWEETLAKFQADPAAAATLATEPLGPLPAGADPAEMAAWTVVGNVLLNLDGVLAKR